MKRFLIGFIAAFGAVLALAWVVAHRLLDEIGQTTFGEQT